MNGFNGTGIHDTCSPIDATSDENVAQMTDMVVVYTE